MRHLGYVCIARSKTRTGYDTAGRSFGPWTCPIDLGEDSLSIAIHTDRPRLVGESAADSRNSDLPAQDVATDGETRFARLRML